MTDAEQLALIYECSILVENADARKQYLNNKYGDALLTAFLASAKKHGGTMWQGTDPLWAPSLAHNVKLFGNTINTIVDKVDPTHGKYSEWLVRQLLQYYTAATNGDFPESSVEWITRPEDQYKVAESLQLFDRHKGKLPVAQRDINAHTFDQMIALADQWLEQDPTNKELIAKSKKEQTLKLLDDFNGWTVVVPLTEDSARLYGAGTKWCTAARGKNCAFNEYNKQAPLFIFIGPNNVKYQLWAMSTENDGDGAALEDDEDADQPYEDVQFMDARDQPVRLDSDILTDGIWEALQGAINKLPDGRLKARLDTAIDIAIWYDHPV